MNYLLDTHTLIWFVDADKRLPDKQRIQITDPRNAIFVSHASLWEIVIKVTIGKLNLSLSFPELEQFMVEKRFASMSSRFAHFETLRHLPLFHQDPFDRLLIAQAIAENFTIITCDPKFQAYPVQLEFF